jgi:uncharacterized protein (DUF362 family)
MNFVRIESVFTENKNRTTADLAKVYDNKSLLKEKISSVVKNILDSESIGGRKILLKPNWVMHNERIDDEICLRTNDSFLLAALEIILVNKPGSVIIGDAPIQGCHWDNMLKKPFLEAIEALSVKYSVPVTIMDFRRVTFDPIQNNPNKERNPLSNYIIFDTGKESYLEPISSTKNNFRVTDYDPDRLAESHTLGQHKYCITKEFFDADLIISMPKIKTHQKAGLTGALKNLVGINGDKDYLPHHRIGGVGFGGDCYPGKNILRRISEWTMDHANRHQGKKAYFFLKWTALIIWKLSIPKRIHKLDAGWHGNDTVWRMVMDLNTIAIYGNKDGTISKKPQRELYTLCDGIVGGQGDGPLHPLPLPLGVICFSNNNSMTDICMATLMGFDIQKISLLRTASQNVKQQKIDLTLNGVKINLADLCNLSIPTTPPTGWIDYLSKNENSHTSHARQF